jgi:tetratricopeptide (TPR) repeat protein
MLARGGVTILAILVTLAGGCRPSSPSPPSPTAQATTDAAAPAAKQPTASPEAIAQHLAAFNRGAALMEQYRYKDAAAEFEKVLAAFPDWLAARFNLGLAYLNMEGQESAGGSKGEKKKLDDARVALEAVLAADPQHVPTKYVLGLYYQHVGEDEQALEYFRAVYDRDPDDPYVVYKCAETLLRLQKNDEGTKLLEKVVALDPGFVSALYRLGLQYQRARRIEEAKTLLTRFKKLSDTELAGGTYVVQEAYGAAGKYYRVLGADNLPLPKAEVRATPKVVFSPETKSLEATSQTWDWAGGKIGLSAIAVGDVDGDGDLDICVTGLGDAGVTQICTNDGSGAFSSGPVLAEHGVCAALGDIDNDGDLDLWLGREGGELLLENDGKGHFKPVANANFARPGGLSHLTRLIDIDSDGDLDLFALRLGKGSVPVGAGAEPLAVSVYRNQRDGNFPDAAQDLGLALAESAIAALVADDFDNDRDLDLLIFPASTGKPFAWVNDRAGGFHLLDAAALGCNVQGAVSATSGDPNKDGRRDVLVFTEAGPRLFLNRGAFRFEEDQEFTRRHGSLKGTGGQFVDIDNDGDLDIVIADAHRPSGERGPVLLVNDWPRGGFANANEANAGSLLNAIQTKADASCVAADFTGDGKCDLLLAAAGDKPVLLVNATPGGHWIELDLSGTSTQDNTTRSNGSAIGARVEVKTGAVLQQFVVGSSSGPVAMAPLRIHAGLGENTKVDWLRVQWPDAVLQAELELPGDQVKPIAELQRKTSSCPCLFAWTGSRFEFVADFGGVGGLGYWIAPDQYTPPDPTEYLPLPRLAPRGGEYVLQCVTPLEEVSYLDEARLISVDHPVGTEVYPHEMMAAAAAPPKFELFCYRHCDKLEPERVTDHRGQDVTDELRAIDRRCAGATSPDRRFVGLADEHFVELDFGGRLKNVRLHARLILFLYGWVEYGYSSTNFAAHQAGRRTQAPSVAVLRHGQWVELFHEVGYPAGINHMMTLDMTGKLLPGDQRLRIVSNMDLHWDAIYLAEHWRDATLALCEAPPAGVDLHFRGYPREYSPDGRHPNLYDYDNCDQAVAWKLMPGQYTRYGEVGELLQAADDCYVIMGHGEEVTLRFSSAAFGPVPPGCQRTFLLKTDSFCKDMDLHTAHPDAVEPLPFHGMSGYPYGPGEHYPETAKTREYRDRYNTRWVGRRPSAEAK